MILDEVEVEIESSHGGFVIDGAVPASPAERAIEENTLLRWWPDTDPELSGFFVSGGSQWGPFAIQARLLDTDPGPPDRGWEDVVEVAVNAAGQIALNEVVDGWVESLAVPPGIYRLRLGARGRTEGFDKALAFPDEDEDESVGVEPSEHFLIEVWPASVSRSVVVRQDSRYARDLLDPPEPVFPPERDPGLQAAWRLVRDVRRQPGARFIPGELSDLFLDLELPGTPTRLFNRLRYGFAWPPCRGATGLTDAVGQTAYFDATLPEFDGPYDSAGHIVTTLLELHKPHRVVVGWNWVLEVNATPSRPVFLWDRPLLLTSDSRVTLSIARSTPPGEEPRCTVQVEHIGVPSAWRTDLADLWTWDLNIRADQ